MSWKSRTGGKWSSCAGFVDVPMSKHSFALLLLSASLFFSFRLSSVFPSTSLLKYQVLQHSSKHSRLQEYLTAYHPLQKGNLVFPMQATTRLLSAVALLFIFNVPQVLGKDWHSPEELALDLQIYRVSLKDGLASEFKFRFEGLPNIIFPFFVISHYSLGIHLRCCKFTTLDPALPTRC